MISTGCQEAAGAMPRIALESIDDPRLAPYRELKRSNLTRWSGLFIAEGEKVTRRLLESDYQIDSVLLGERFAATLAGLARSDVPVYVLPDKLVERVVGFNFHRGVLACGRRNERLSLESLAQRGAASTLVVLPELHDPENLGSIVRTSRALGVTGILLGPRTADFLSRRVVRVSMGGVFHVPIRRADDLLGELRRLRDEFGYELIATAADHPAGVPPGILLGSEGHGLEAPLLELCQHVVTIPIQLAADSLNVAIAAGIILHGLARPG
jgi:tRNA G18 (ribose-2'-O)-methylase SpoU